MAASFIYLYIAITKYLHNHEVILANRRAKQGFKRVEKAKQKILDNTSKVDHNRDKSNN
jgi:hypothetical protein